MLLSRSARGGETMLFVYFAISLFLGLLAVVYIWMAILVSWLGYDYVTVSSILFLLSVVGVILQVVARFVIAPREAAFQVFIFIGLYPLLFSGALRLYEAWQNPEMSDATNVVEYYRNLVAAPINFVSMNIAEVGPVAAQTVSVIDDSTILSQLIVTIIVASTTWILRMTFGLNRSNPA